MFLHVDGEFVRKRGEALQQYLQLVLEVLVQTLNPKT
jgi:hypothetical protein